MSPFVTVTSTHDEVITHLVVVSPALPGVRPDTLPQATLCGRRTAATAAAHPADVKCPRCLQSAPKYMGLPAFEAVR